MNNSIRRTILKASSVMILLGTNMAFGQSSFYNPRNCHIADKTSMEKFIASLGLAGSAIGFWGTIAEDGHMSKLGSVIGFGVVLYKYFFDPKPVEICYGTTPDGKGIGLIGEVEVMRKPSPALGQDYKKLGGYLGLESLPAPSQQVSPATSGVDLERIFKQAQFLQSLKVSLRGSVTNHITGYPISDATVRIVSAESPGVWENLSTNIKGVFDSAELPGKYIVYAHADGFQDFTTTVTINASATDELKIELTRFLIPRLQ